MQEKNQILLISMLCLQQTFHQKKYHITYKTFQLTTRNVGGLKQAMHVWEGSDQKPPVQTNP